MRLVRTFLTWLRTRKRASTALTFETLLKRAEQQSTTSRDTDRPDYLPKPGAASRVGLAIAGGLSLYSGIAIAVAAFWWNWPSFGAAIAIVPLIALPLVLLAIRIGGALVRNFRQHDAGRDSERTDWGWEATTLRILCWPITEPLCVLFGWLAKYLYYGIDRVCDHWAPQKESSASGSSQATTREDAIRRIPDLIVAIIQEERERLFGNASPFAGLRKKIETELEEARKLHAYFTRRAADAGTAERRTTAIDRAAAVRDQLDGERKRLDEWRARVDAELGAYRDRVQGLGPEIDELVHYRALSRLEQSTAQLAAEVEAMIAEMTTNLLTRVHGRCAELSGALHDASAHVAVAAAQTGNADRDVRIITDTVRELVRRAPTYDAAAVTEELRRPTRPAVLG